MANVYQCDRCRTIIKIEANTRVHLIPMSSELNKRELLIDLCPHCCNDLINEFINKCQ